MRQQKDMYGEDGSWSDRQQQKILDNVRQRYVIQIFCRILNPLFAGDDRKKCSKGGSWSEMFMEGNIRKFWT